MSDDEVLDDPDFQDEVIRDMWRVAASEMRRNVARHRGACPCSCNSGGFCGGCGHRGCGLR